MGYISSDDALSKKLTIRYTNLGKRYLVTKENNLHQIKSFNLGDSDINYKTIITDYEIPDNSGDESCFPETKSNVVEQEIFLTGKNIGYGLYNESGIGRLESNDLMRVAFADLLQNQTFNIMTNIKIDSGTNDVTILTLNSLNTNQTYSQLQISTFDNLSILKFSFKNIFVDDLTGNPKYYSGEVNYVGDVFKTNHFFNLSFSKSLVLDNLFNCYVDGHNLANSPTIKVIRNYTISDGVIPRFTPVLNVISSGNLTMRRLLAINREFEVDERINGYLLTYPYIGDILVDFQCLEGENLTTVDSTNTSRLFSLNDIKWT